MQLHPLLAIGQVRPPAPKKEKEEEKREDTHVARVELYKDYYSQQAEGTLDEFSAGRDQKKAKQEFRASKL